MESWRWVGLQGTWNSPECRETVLEAGRWAKRRMGRVPSGRVCMGFALTHRQNLKGAWEGPWQHRMYTLSVVGSTVSPKYIHWSPNPQDLRM